MVLTEAFAAGTPVVASDIAGYRDVVTDGVDGLLVPRGDATRLAETLRDLALDRRAHRGASAPPPRHARRALRLAADRRAGRRGLRGRARGARARDRCRARAAVRIGAAARRRPAALAGAPPAVARAAAVEPAAGRSRSPAARRSRPRRSAPASGRYLAVERIGLRPDRATRSCAPSRSWVLVGAGADVRSRCCCAPSPGTRSCKAALPDALPRMVDADPGHDDRRADVGHAAGPARRALARARRRPPPRPRRVTGCPSCSARSSRRR